MIESAPDSNEILGDSSEPSLTWDDFRKSFEFAMSYEGDPLSPDTQLSQFYEGDRTQAALAFAAMRKVLRDPPDDLLISIETLGSAYEWSLAGSGPGELGARSRQRDAGRSRALTEMRTRSIKLRPIQSSDMQELYASALDPRWSFKWRFRGLTPSFQEFSNALYSGSLCQFVVQRLSDRRALGLVSCYNARHDAGIAYIAFTRTATPGTNPNSEMMEAGYLFIAFVFQNWDFRKLYAEVPGFTWGQFERAADTFFHVEGVLKDHDYFDGKYWDHRLLAIYRSEWTAVAEGLLQELYDVQEDQASESGSID